MHYMKLVQEISDKTKYTKSDIKKIMRALIEVIKENIEKGEKVNVWDFGVFKISLRGQQRWRSLKTGKFYYLPPLKKVNFSMSKNYKARINPDYYKNRKKIEE